MKTIKMQQRTITSHQEYALIIDGISFDEACKVSSLIRDYGSYYEDDTIAFIRYATRSPHLFNTVVADFEKNGYKVDYSDY